MIIRNPAVDRTLISLVSLLRFILQKFREISEIRGVFAFLTELAFSNKSWAKRFMVMIACFQYNGSHPIPGGHECAKTTNTQFKDAAVLIDSMRAVDVFSGAAFLQSSVGGSPYSGGNWD
jgi:hypothetical protein